MKTYVNSHRRYSSVCIVEFEQVFTCWVLNGICTWIFYRPNTLGDALFKTSWKSCYFSFSPVNNLDEVIAAEAYLGRYLTSMIKFFDENSLRLISKECFGLRNLFLQIMK